MNQEINKYLTEAMGLCWHKWVVKYVKSLRANADWCKHCEAQYFSLKNPTNPDFSTWQGFGTLVEFLSKGGLYDFIDYFGGIEKLPYYLYPERFAKKLYEYWRSDEFKSKKRE